MTTKEPVFVTRVHQAEHLGNFVKLANGQGQLLEIEPRAIYLVSAQQAGAPEEIIGSFKTLEAAQEAAESLDKQMRAIVGTDAQGLKLATRDGRTIQ